MLAVPEPEAQPAGRNGKFGSASAPAKVMSAPPVVAQVLVVLFHLVHMVEPLATATAPAPSMSWSAQKVIGAPLVLKFPAMPLITERDALNNKPLLALVPKLVW